MTAESIPNKDLGEIFAELPGAGDAPIISMTGAGVSFGGIRALDDIDLEAKAHSITAVIGPNGAGKSTLLNMISGLVKSDSGTIEFLGRRVERMGASGRARAGMGRSFQDPSLIESATVLENVLCGANVVLGYGMLDQIVRRRRVVRMEREATNRALHVLDFVGLSDQANDSVSNLSYGKRKLVDIARAMVAGPSLLLLDEPTSGLDSGERELVRQILSEVHDQARTTMILVEHHMDLVRSTATHVYALEAGRVLMSGSPEDVFDSGSFQEAMIAPATTRSE
jgi:branched-chain amino acid transport system ATP-binding protein